MILFERSVTFTVAPQLSQYRDCHFVRQSNACVADYTTPITTAGVATCSALIMHDDSLSRQLLAHVGPMDCAEDIRDGINQHFNISSKFLTTIIIPGAGANCIKPTLSLPIAERAVHGIQYNVVDNWYTDPMEYISVHEGIIQKCDNESIRTAKESLPRSLICKPF